MNELIAKVWRILGKLPQRQKIALAVATGVLAGIVLHWALSPAQMAKEERAVAASQEQTIEKITTWTCAMHPHIRLPKPGLCPICNMTLIPVSVEVSETTISIRQLVVSENAKKLMDIVTVPVERKFVTATTLMVGKVDYDETSVEYITAWIPGRLDRLYVDYTGVSVNKGDHMVYLYSPELLSAQEELLQAIQAVKNIQDTDISIMLEMTRDTVTAVREKLRLWGLAPEQIENIERTGKVSDHVTIYAPSSGIVIHKNGLEGMYVKEGTRIYTIADLSQVWVKLDAYESDLMWLRYGQEVEFTTVSYPGEVFKGIISFIDPILNPVTRSVKIRVNVPNTDGKLKPGMFVKAAVKTKIAAGGKVMAPALAGKWICPMHPEIIKETTGKCDICEMDLVPIESMGYVSSDIEGIEKPLVIPVTAALITGTRAIVYVQVPDTDKPTFEGREIILGPRAGDYYIVRRGLKEGERVVVQGNFKIDAELQIQAKPSMMTPQGGGGGGGHDHGGKNLSGKGTSAGAVMQLPAVVKSQLHAVALAGEEVNKAIEVGDVAGIRSAFAVLEQKVNAVEQEKLQGHMVLLWKDYSMFLINDYVEGKSINHVSDAKRVAEMMNEHLTYMKSGFGLSPQHRITVTPAVSPEFRRQFGEVIESYLVLQQALAADKFNQAGAASKKTLDALSGVDMKLLEGDEHLAWMNHTAELKKILSSAAEGTDIEAVRNDFALLSEQMMTMVKRFGPPGGSLYQFKCPMAFSGRGATWLQSDDKTQNPYLGTAMSECGDVIEVIPALEDKENPHE